MKQIVVNFDEIAMEIVDKNGVKWSVGSTAEELGDEYNQPTSSVDDFVKLKDAGFDADDIMRMKREGLI